MLNGVPWAQILTWRLAVALVVAVAVSFGLTLPWRFRKGWRGRQGWLAFLFVLVIMWVAVSIFALTAHGWSPDNPGFSFGDIALAGAIGIGSMQVKFLLGRARCLFLITRGFRFFAMATGYVVGLGLEIAGYQSTHRLPVGLGDWYHHALYGPMAYWILSSLIGAGYYFFKIERSWRFPVVTALVLIWLALIVLQASTPQADKHFYGWDDLIHIFLRLAPWD